MKNYFDKTKEELIKEIELLRKQIQSNFSNCHLGITDKENPSFLNVMENTPLSIIIFNDEQIYFTNKAFQELTEYNQHEIDKMKFSDFTYSEDRHILEEEIIKCNLSQINSINTEIRITTHNKKNKWIELIANKINYNNKEVIFSIAVDITEKNEILDQKNILNDQLSFTIKSIVEGVITTNAEGKIVMMNNTAEILTEWNSDDALGRNINDVFCLVNEKKEEKNHISIKDMIDSKKIFNNAISTKLISKNKKKRVIQYYLAPISDNKQNVCGGIIIFKDRSEQKILEEQLKEIEEVYNTLFEAAPDAILIMQDDKFVNCNNKTLAIFQCTKEQIIGKPPFYFSPEYQPDGRPSKIVAWEKISLAQSGIPQAFEWKHTRYNRTDFDAEVFLHNIIIQGQLYLQAIVKDVTEQKNVQKNLKKSEEMFRLFFKSTSQSITINNAVTNEKGELIDAIIIEANPAFGNMTGIEYKKAAGMKLSEVNPFVYKELLKGYEESLKINYPYRFDFYSKFSNKFNEFIIYGIKKDQFAIICSDITERKREEETKR
ncbi:MAG TPA: PAS domain S-box protein, partial [Bacteroidales bacterium]|nr:PAS domain S-box protein [Bacteroidales bacterium]